jgi:hypothetical protein
MPARQEARGADMPGVNDPMKAQLPSDNLPAAHEHPRGTLAIVIVFGLLLFSASYYFGIAGAASSGSSGRHSRETNSSGEIWPLPRFWTSEEDESQPTLLSGKLALRRVRLL